ncbi:MAG TPA: hypothetical protein VHS96_03590, partial [Bacteroidia bacterium]|nr:hypothetical protein [Bacteroidia bacterium]
MATIQSPFPISGSCGDFTFATNGKTNYMKMKNWLQGDRWHKSKEFKRARENAQTFGGAAKVGCRIYSTLASPRNNAKEGKSRKVYRPYAHNFITKRLHKHALKNGRVADHYGFLAAYPALRGLDLSNEESGTALVSMTPVGPAHCPHHLKVQGLREVADNILRNLNGNCTLEVRLQLTYIDYPEAKYDAADREWNHTKTGSHLSRKSPKSAWIPTDFLPEVLSLSLLDASKATDAN